MTAVIIILLLILVNGFFSMAEISLISARKSKLQSESEQGNKQAGKALKLASDPDVFLSSAQIGITLVGILTGIFSGADIADSLSKVFVNMGMAAGGAEALAKTIIVVIVMFLTTLLGELVPKRIAMNNPEKIAKQIARPMAAFDWIVKPLIAMLAKCTEGITKMLGIKNHPSKVTEDEIVSMLQESTDEGEVSPVEQDIVERVFTLGDLSINTIMTLRDDIVSLDVNMTENQVRKTIERKIVEQYPVVDGDLNHIEGVMNLKDFVLNMGKDDFNIRKLMRKPVWFHENMSVYNVLEYMKKHRVNRGLVCDEFGSLEGIISVKDILDALVGNLGNENLREPDIIKRKGGEGWIVDGQCSIYDFLIHFDLDDSMEDYDFSTVAGLVLERLEHVPSTGETCQWNGFTFEVADMDGARIDKLIVTRSADSGQSE
jgi:putative hemolysin